jgi:hypothetical protein
MKLLPVTFEELPVTKTFKLLDKEYEFRFRHNSRYDFITLELWYNNSMIHSSKLVYGSDFLKSANTEIPFALIPLIEDDLYKEGFSDIVVNKDTFGKTVFIYFEDGL